MILRAIIIDDEQKGINSLKLAINEFVTDVKVVADSTHPKAAIELIENYKPDIVFLDINMPDTNGFELLEKLDWKNFNLVFVTAHSEYALRALKNNAVDYLLKPIDYMELQATVARIKTRIAQQENMVSMVKYASLFNELEYGTGKNKLFINLKTAVEPVDLEEIIYLESSSNYTHIHLTGGKIIVASRNLRDFESHLCTDHHFMRVHHSFIINIRKVLRYLKAEEQIIMVNNKPIPLAKSKKGSFYSWLSPKD